MLSVSAAGDCGGGPGEGVFELGESQVRSDAGAGRSGGGGTDGAVAGSGAVAVLRDYIDCVHIGGFRRAHGAPDTHGCETIQYVGCAMEQADTYIPDWVAALKDARVDAPLIIEDYEGGVTGAQRLTRSARL